MKHLHTKWVNEDNRCSGPKGRISPITNRCVMADTSDTASNLCKNGTLLDIKNIITTYLNKVKQIAQEQSAMPWK